NSKKRGSPALPHDYPASVQTRSAKRIFSVPGKYRFGKVLQPVGTVNATGVRASNHLGGRSSNGNISSTSDRPRRLFSIAPPVLVRFQTCVSQSASLQPLPCIIGRTAIHDDDLRRRERLVDKTRYQSLDVFRFIKHGRDYAD